MNKKTIVAALLLLSVFLVTGCTVNGALPKEAQPTPQPSPAGAYQKISPEEAHRMMDEAEGYILLDVRTKEEYDQSHIPGAVLLPVTEIQEQAGEQLKDKDTVLLVYCRSGRRSAQAAQQLADMGYTKVCDFGGIIDWPYETVSGTGEK